MVTVEITNIKQRRNDNEEVETYVVEYQIPEYPNTYRTDPIPADEFDHEVAKERVAEEASPLISGATTDVKLPNESMDEPDESGRRNLLKYGAVALLGLGTIVGGGTGMLVLGGGGILGGSANNSTTPNEPQTPEPTTTQTNKATTDTPVSLEDLVAQWQFDDSSAGETAVDSIGSYDGKITQAQRVTVQSRTGLKFSENSLVETDYEGVLGQAPRTISFWAKTTEDRWMEVCTYGKNTSGGAFRVGLNGRPGGEGPSEGVTVDCSFGAVTYGTETADGGWHHYAFVVPESGTPTVSDVRIYQDGAQLEDPDVTYRPDQSIETTEGQPVWLGGWNRKNHPYIGILDDVRIYKSEIGSDMIQTLYNNTQ